MLSYPPLVSIQTAGDAVARARKRTHQIAAKARSWTQPTPAAIKMNVLAATRAYVDRIVSDPNNPGMKVLLLGRGDDEDGGERLQPDGNFG